MVQISDIIKKWGDLSVSETKPLFWMLLGPFLILLTISIAAPFLSNPFLPLFGAFGLLLSWKYRVSGLILTLMGIVFYYALGYLFGFQEILPWKLGWGISLILGLTISFLSMEELKNYYNQLKEGKEQAFAKLQLSLQSFEEKTAVEKRTQDQEIETFKEEISSAREEIESLLNLIEAIRIESDKVYKQNDMLTKESLKMHRELEGLKLTTNETLKKLTTLSEEYQSLSETARQRLHFLNTVRVELYQARFFNETYQGQIKRAREYFLSQKKKESPLQHKGEKLILKTLEKDKGKIKKSYDLLLKDYQEIKKTNALDSEIKEKKLKLEKTKSELVGIEREIFIIKKKLQEQHGEISLK